MTTSILKRNIFLNGCLKLYCVSNAFNVSSLNHDHVCLFNKSLNCEYCLCITVVVHTPSIPPTPAKVPALPQSARQPPSKPATGRKSKLTREMSREFVILCLRSLFCKTLNNYSNTICNIPSRTLSTDFFTFSGIKPL